jgi:hypothetical protein
VTLRHLIGLALLAVVAGCAGGGDGVHPGRRDVFLGDGRQDRFVVTVDLARGPLSREPLDVFLLFDVTASMGNVIDAVRQSAFDVMESVRALSPDTAFGVGAFADYPPYGEPWRLHQDITLDIGAVRRALESLELSDGGDLPEAYSRGLYETRFVGWRAEARRIVVLFGDAPARDADFYGRHYGIDPGRDGTPGTADDLRFRDVVRQLAEDRISVLAVYDETRGPRNKSAVDDAIKGFEYLARETGGVAKPVKAARDIPSAIKLGLREAYRRRPALMVPDEWRGWVTVSEPRPIGPAGRRFEFDVTIAPPAGAVDAIHRFPLLAVEAGRERAGEIGRTDVTVRIGLVNYAWERLLPLLPLLLLLLLLLRLVAGSARRPGFVRYQRNGQFARVGAWAMVAVVLVASSYLLGRHADDTFRALVGRIASR